MTGRASSVSIKRRGIVALLTLAALALALAGCGDGGMAQSGNSGVAKMGEHAGGAAFGHVHGLGINPRDGALFIATHGGLFRAAAGDAQARQVGKSQQDLMGFTVVGPNQFVASGHPDPAAGGPSNLGLVRSDDAGRGWSQVSLLGEADFHVLRAAGQTIYGFDQSRGLMVSTNGGRSWSDAGSLGGQPVAFAGAGGDLYAALGDGVVMGSADGGANWAMRARH